MNVKKSRKWIALVILFITINLSPLLVLSWFESSLSVAVEEIYDQDMKPIKREPTLKMLSEVLVEEVGAFLD